MAEDLLTVLTRLQQDLVERIDQLAEQMLATNSCLQDFRNEMRAGFEKMHTKFDRLERAQAELKAALIHAGR